VNHAHDECISTGFYQYTERIITVTVYIAHVHELDLDTEMDTTIKYHVFQIKSCIFET
jgi:hypothetical protein